MTKPPRAKRWNTAAGLRSLVGLRDVWRKHPHLVSAGLGSAVIKVGHVALTTGITIVLARTLEPSGYGVYAYVFALVSLLALPAESGLPHLVIRETAKAYVANRWDTISNLWHWATRAVVLISAAITLSAAGIALVVAARFTRIELGTFAWGLALIPLLALGNVRGASLRGLRRTSLGQVPEYVLRPSLFLCLLFAYGVMFGPARLTASNAMMLHVCSAAGTFIIATVLVVRARPAFFPEAQVDVAERRVWRASAFPFAMITAFQLLNRQTDILALGLFGSADDVGIYRVAVQASALVSFSLEAVNLVIAPRLAALHEQGRVEDLHRLAVSSARVVFAVAIPVVTALILFGRPLLEFVFGLKYGAAHSALIILALGQLISAVSGSVGYLLNMTGHERDTFRGVAFSAIVTIVLSVILIPPFGIVGAAVAKGVTVAVWNLLLLRQVKRRLGFYPTAFSRTGKGD
jgi:O-antigen/teichoic acid export membrane protein